MNILSFDIEEWYLESVKANRQKKLREYDGYLNTILDAMDQNGQKATFFCVGEMGRCFPEVIRLIDAKGHEVGCHSNVHTWLNKMNQDEALEDTRRAVDSLEQCIGKKVLSYRAPAFSIGKSNEWAFAVLKECGIERDASVFPAGRDFGGFAGFGSKEPCVIQSKGVTLKEFPICTTELIGKEVAFSGGGYFRFFPLWFVESAMKKSKYNMTYFHIGDLVPERRGVMTREEYEEYFKEAGTLMARYKRYIKSNLGKSGALDKMLKLMRKNEFVNVMQADELIDWTAAPIVQL